MSPPNAPRTIDTTSPRSTTQTGRKTGGRSNGEVDSRSNGNGRLALSDMLELDVVQKLVERFERRDGL